MRIRKIGICDIVEMAERDKVDASDLGMQNIKLRNIIGYLKEYKNVDTLIFTGGNSKNGPEYFFRKHLNEHEISLKVISNDVPRIHQFVIPNISAEGSIYEESLQSLPVENKNPRTIKTVSLTAPSGAANRAVGSMASYKNLKDQNPEFNTFDFRVLQYAPFF